MTSASFPIPFPIGAEVWWVGHACRETWATCPECDGTRALTIIKGNGETVSVGCGNCTSGYNPPSGRVQVTAWERSPTPFVCNRVEVYGDDIRYSEAPSSATSYTTANASDLFTDRDTCAARCVVLNEEHAAEMASRALHNLTSSRRDVAFSVSYWGRKVKDLERDLVLARERLTVSKAARKSGGLS